MLNDKTIEEIMQEYDLTESQISQRTGVSIPYVSKLKRNKIVASEEAQKKFFEAFGFYVINEEIKFQNECEQLRYINYQNQIKIAKLQKEITKLKSAIEKCYEVLKK